VFAKRDAGKWMARDGKALWLVRKGHYMRPQRKRPEADQEQTREARTLARPKGFAWSLVASLGRCLFGLGSSVGAPSPADPLAF
jgi:hypothetical protein